jgi:hypothetical protein
MISPDYFSFRWSLFQPVLNRREQPSDRCTVEVRRLPIRVLGQDAGDYIPYAVHASVDRAISTSLCRLQDYAIRYMVRGEKVSAHKLPHMNARLREMVAYLRKQNPHLSRDLLHHWCADPQGAPALLQVCEVLWEQGWKQDQVDGAAPWVPAVNVLLLKLIRDAVAFLPDEEEEITNHVMLHVVGGLYVWALQAFLKRYLDSVAETRRIASYESIMLPVTPMAFLHYQPDISLLADDSRVIRIYGLEPEIVPQLRYLRTKVDTKNETDMPALLAKDRLGAHLLQRTWARLSLWKLALQSGHGAWMYWVLDAKRLDQLLAGQSRPDTASIENLKAFRSEPVAAWLLAQMEGGRAKRNVGEPWLRDSITLMAFQVFDEDVKVEVARRKAERVWMDKKPEQSGRKKTRGFSRLGGINGLRSVSGSETDEEFEKAWQHGELILIQADVTKALYRGRALPLRHGCLRIEWSDYLARMHMLSGAGSDDYLAGEFLPGVLAAVETHESLFLDECSASGCLLRGPVLDLFKAGIELRCKMRQWCLSKSAKEDGAEAEINLPALSMCLDMTGEWTYAERKHAKLGQYRIAFALAVPQANAGVARDTGIGRLIHSRDSKLGLKPVGEVRVEAVATGTGQTVQMLYNAGFALTASAVTELASVLANRASIRDFRLHEKQVKSLLNGYRLPPGGLELLVIQRFGIENEPPWLLMKAGRPCLAGMDVDIFELLDADSEPARQIVCRGLSQWMS